MPRPALLSLLPLVTALLMGCGARDGTAPPEEAAGGATGETAPSNLLLVTVDTLRADRLSVYGGDVTVPTVAGLASEGVVFDNAACPMPVTRPSHASLFTGRYPREHGVVDNQLALPEEELTLAEILRDAGFATAAFTGVRILGPRSGLDQGFDVLEAPEGGRDPAALVVSRAVDWLGRRPEGPFFLWVHVYDPHMPYAPPPEFLGEADGPVKVVGWKELSRLARERGGELGEAALAQARRAYGGEIASVDASLGRLVRALGEAIDDTAVVFTADHGECFENGFFFRHAGCLYDGAARVPLVIRAPGALPLGERRSSPVELVDLPGTLLGLLGVAVPGEVGGVDLFAGPRNADRFAFLEHPLMPEGAVRRRGNLWDDIETVVGVPMAPVLRGTQQVGLRGRRWKYIATGGKGEELYDLSADPDETTDVAESYPEIVRSLRDEVRRIRRDRPLRELDPGHIHPELRAHLEALGYL